MSKLLPSLECIGGWWACGSLWMSAENLILTVVHTLISSALKLSLYRLCYPGRHGACLREEFHKYFSSKSLLLWGGNNISLAVNGSSFDFHLVNSQFSNLWQVCIKFSNIFLHFVYGWEILWPVWYWSCIFQIYVKDFWRQWYIVAYYFLH